MKKRYLAMFLAVPLALTPVSAYAGVENLFTDGEQTGYEAFMSEEADAQEEFSEASLEEEAPVSEEETEAEEPELIEEEAVEASVGSFTYQFDKKNATAAVSGYSGNSGSLVIPSTVSEGGVSYRVVKINRGVFKNHKELTSVSIPSTITSIGEDYNTDGAFEGCTLLSEVTIAEGNQRAVIGGNAFSGCTSLKNIRIPGNYYHIQYRAFADCTSLKSMTLGRNTIGEKQTICERAFVGCRSLEEISLPSDSLESIREFAFENCLSLTKAVIPEGVREVRRGAFKNNTALTGVSLPSTIEMLGADYGTDGAFEGCVHLSSVTMKEGRLKAVLGGSTFNGCKSLTSIVIPGNYYHIQYKAFADCISLKSMTLKQNTIGEKQTICERAFVGCKSLAEISLPSVSLESICEFAFADCLSLTKAVIPEGVREVRRGAFKNNTALTGVSLPSTIEMLGADYNTDGAFEGCVRLSSVTMKEGRLKAVLGGNTFNGCKSLPSIVIPGNYYHIQYKAFADCTGLKTMTLGQNTIGEKQTICERAFVGCSSLAEISLPSDSLESICEFAFADCISLAKAVIPEGVREIRRGAFKNDSALKSVSLPSTIEKLGAAYSSDGVFENCKQLADVTMKEGFFDAYVGGNTFKNCTSLRTIVIPGNYQKLYDGVFSGCGSLLDVKLCESSYAFESQSIGAYVVDNCGKLINFQIPATVGTIADRACGNCTVLTIIGKTGSRAESFASEKGIKFRTAPLPIGSVTLAKPTMTSVKQSSTSYQVVLKWKSVANAKGYYVYRKAGSGAYKKIATVTGTSYSDKAAKSVGTSYTYTVRAYGGAGTTAGSSAAGLKLTVRPFTPKITSLSVTGSGMKVQWKSVTNASGYYVYRREGSGSWKRIASVGKTIRSYTDKTAAKGKKYSYRIYAYKTAGSKTIISTASSILTGKR